MPKKVYVNVADYKLMDGKREVEDVTSVTLPSVSHPTVSIDAAGMAGAVEMPNQAKLEAMEFTINHNNGRNCNRLTDPDQHSFEFRVARQRYMVEKGQLGIEGAKYRVVGVHKGTEHGTVEAGNPLGSTERYAVLRFERIMDGEVDVLVDVMKGIINFNGIDANSDVRSVLD